MAHISQDGRKQTLKDHLTGTADLAERFAHSFGAAKAARLSALLHDIGKGSEVFQNRLRGSGKKVDHSTAGALALLKRRQTEAAFAVAGHHVGLPDGGSRIDTVDAHTMVGRSKRHVEPYDLPEDLPPPPDVPPSQRSGFEQAFYTRMLFSCLVDADFLDTESFMRGPQPRGGGESIPVLLEKVRRRAEDYLSSSSEKSVDQIRNQILQICIQVGQTEERGLFSLKAPTGGGKTISSLAFALEHAAKHNMDRVIFVEPYTGIIDQTVLEYEAILGKENVLGHYSSADFFLMEENEMSPEDYERVLSTENWDVPVIVTTAVQFFESLFANSPAQCRKLHNIANAVLIFDEAQTLPTDYLMPCLSAVAELVQHYGSSAVFCTATQPAFGNLFKELAPGLTMREICPENADLFLTMRRTTLKRLDKISLEVLAGRLSDGEQVLCVVNRRVTAQRIYEQLPAEGRYCLTTLLCAADRRRQLEEIRSRLRAGLPCRVVSTSLVEAGVDVDFPTAYREEAGLDSVIQTAGRCNREGLRDPDRSFVYLFALDGISPPVTIGQNLNALRHVLHDFTDIQSSQAVDAYFDFLYKIEGKEALDRKGIMTAFEEGVSGCFMPFAYVAEQFHLIDAPTKIIYIPIGEGAALCQRLQCGNYSRALFRKLGMYIVSVYPRFYDDLLFAGALEETKGGAILTDLRRYDPHLGLSLSSSDDNNFIL